MSQPHGHELLVLLIRQHDRMHESLRAEGVETAPHARAFLEGLRAAATLRSATERDIRALLDGIQDALHILAAASAMPMVADPAIA